MKKIAAIFISLLMSLPLTGCMGPHVKGYKTKPYSVRGGRYYPISPRQAVGYSETGVASHYDESWFIFPGKTSTGENLWPWTHAAAHKTLPLPCKIRVTNMSNGRSTVVRCNDRGPFIRGRMLDVTEPVAKQLGFYNQGLANVKIKVLSVGDGSYRIK